MLKMDKVPVNEERQKALIHAVIKGKEDFEKPKHLNISLRESQTNVIQIQYYP